MHTKIDRTRKGKHNDKETSNDTYKDKQKDNENYVRPMER